MIVCPICNTDIRHELEESYTSCRCSRLVMDDMNRFIFAIRVPYVARWGQLRDGLLLVGGVLFRTAPTDCKSELHYTLSFMGDIVPCFRINAEDAEDAVMGAIYEAMSAQVLEA